MTDRPVIGITAYEENATWGGTTQRAVIVPATYVRSVERAGGAVLVLPVQSEGLDRLLERIDALVLTGGPDVAADRYGEAPHPATSRPRVERDGFEIALANAAISNKTPTLAICRGMQLLNVARGGTLHQHLPDVVGHDGHTPGDGGFVVHRVEIDPDSRLGAILQASTIDGASQHHQAVAQLGRGLRVVANAEDGTIEAVEDPSLPYLIGVQWHPEEGEDETLFRSLVESARRRN